MNGELTAIWTKIESMVRDFLTLLPTLTIAIIVFFIFFAIARIIKQIVRRTTAHHRHARNLGLVLGRLAQGSIILLGTFVALSIVIPSFKAGDLVQLLGIGGVAIGFAFRDILQNFLSGILILLTEPFRIGDQIVFKNFEGTVEQIETRATTIVTYDNRRILIPNSELFTNSVTVNTAFDNRRIEYEFSIGYGDDIEWVKRSIYEALDRVEQVLREPPPDVLVVDLTESSINIRVRWWIKPPRRIDDLRSRSEVLSAIEQKLYGEGGIELPYPTLQIIFPDRVETTKGDCHRSRMG